MELMEAIMKNKQTWKGCWKESELTVSFRHFVNDGAIWLLCYYCRPQDQWLKRKVSPADNCLLSSNWPAKKSKTCWHILLFSWLYFMNLLYPPAVILKRCTSVQNGAMHQAYFTQSVDLLNSLKTSQFCLPLAHYHWWVQHSLLVQILWAQLNGEESSPSHMSGLHLPLQLGRIHINKGFLPNFVLKQFRTLQ